MIMKKTLFLFILIFIFSNNLFAQAPISSCDDHAEFYDPLKTTAYHKNISPKLEIAHGDRRCHSTKT